MNHPDPLARLEERMDRMARVNELVLDRQERIDTILNRVESTLARIADRQAELADVADILDSGLGTLIRAFVAHRQDGHGA